MLYVPVQFTAAGPFVEALPAPDYFVMRVAPMDERGRFNASLNAGWEYSAALWLRRNRPQTRIVFEVCPHLPRVRGLAEHGDNELPLDLADHHRRGRDTAVPARRHRSPTTSRAASPRTSRR